MRNFFQLTLAGFPSVQIGDFFGTVLILKALAASTALVIVFPAFSRAGRLLPCYKCYAGTAAMRGRENRNCACLLVVAGSASVLFQALCGLGWQSHGLPIAIGMGGLFCGAVANAAYLPVIGGIVRPFVGRRMRRKFIQLALAGFPGFQIVYRLGPFLVFISRAASEAVVVIFPAGSGTGRRLPCCLRYEVNARHTTF